MARPGGAGLAVLCGGGVTAEEAEPTAAELIGVMGQEAEGEELAAEEEEGGRVMLRARERQRSL